MNKFASLRVSVPIKACTICGEPTSGKNFDYCSDCWTAYINTSNCASCNWKTNDSIVCNDRCPYAQGQLPSSKEVALQIAILKQDQRTIEFCRN